MNEKRNIKSRIEWFCQNKINAFSPTISPAPKSWDKNEIESPFEGLKYYFDRGVTQFVVQKKYMGSYCDIYLKKEINDSYFVSRNGHKVMHIDVEKAIMACSDIHARFNWKDLSLVIIQAEMLPWSVLGKGLINNEFWAYHHSHKTHHDYLKHSELYDKIEKVRSSEAYQKYISDKKVLSEKAIKKEYPSHVTRQYDSIEAFKMLDLDKYEQGISIFGEQISHFGSDGDISFKPFNVLKKVFDDGSEIVVNDNFSFGEVSDDEFLEINIESPDELETKAKMVTEWFNKLSADKEEGIVIKPRISFLKDLPPAFKVRNNQYLVMIYGIDFINNYQYNMQKRNIDKKIKCSINDWAINHVLLKVKYKDIHSENYHLKNLVYDRIMGEKIESTIDSRL
ncbi:MAG: hypothetical protein KA270_03470 [Saprospiraceae bacterium]|nr:hypothetical protein [Saprospiraceae bacterium]MBP6566199.1 hypothetical protein [Saprospiraceae bacterium]